VHYDAEHFVERTPAGLEECAAVAQAPGIKWINVIGLHQSDTIYRLGEIFRLHPLAVEDILDTNQRVKVEYYEDYALVVLKGFSWGKDDELEQEQISLVLLAGAVLSFQESAPDAFAGVRERLRAGKGRIRQLGADYLAYALLDTLVDAYFDCLEQLDERLEQLEEEVVQRPDPRSVHGIHRLRRSTIALRRALWSQREVMASLENAGPPLFQTSTLPYLRDVHDHAIMLVDTVETLRDLLSGILDLYLSSASHRLNGVMKLLTIIGTIFMPLTFLAGVYGMNFRYMPELNQPWAYPAVWAIMLATAAGMVQYFRRKKWRKPLGLAAWSWQVNRRPPAWPQSSISA
jgi:magnesium transporter